MGRHRDEIWQELRELDNRVTQLEDRAILKPEYDPADVALDDAAKLLAKIRQQRDKFWIQRDEARAERDALRARIEGGRVMYGGNYGREHDIEMWTFNHVDTDTMTARLIDIAPIAADERKGERRSGEVCSYWDSHDRIKYGRRFSTTNNRRRTPGTIADRRTVNQTGTIADRKESHHDAA